MKQGKNQNFIRFNQFVFIGLLTLWSVLLVIFCSKSLRPDLNEFSKEDFENELMGQAYFAGLNHNYQAEIQLYQQVMEKLPEREAELNFSMGKASFADGKYLDAIKYYNNALAAGYCDSSEIYFHVGLTAQKLKKYEMAEKYYLLSVHHQQYEKEAYFNLGNICFFELKDEEKALDYYERAIEDKSVKYAYKRMLLRELKVYPARKDSLLNQFLLTELESLNNRNKFDCYYLTGFGKVKPEKTQSLIHNYIGIIKAKKNDKIAAISHFQKAMEIDPDFADAKFNFNKLVSESRNQ
ncbi:hypothetical protein OU798_19990 [Prolixibacteraceae bacterium Z1-6]|uniref:Tetratricopeptide repeat protein n=1 Tax=Draconibacterium aestuarii TaxID=2998507 RepID=A0A9X3FAC7_9BACT|nr:hypothetical protein [Prolixibacteraceae bacterium Z1-6]